MSAGPWPMRCPACGVGLGSLPADASAAAALDCGACGGRWPRVDGIWRLMTAADASRTDDYVRQYTAVRRAEGRAAMGVPERLALPYPLPSTPLAWQWWIRAASYRALCRRALGAVAPGRLVDVGAGTGWLAWRLAVAGWTVLAVDVSDDAGDGLGAVAVYAADLAARGAADRLTLAVGHADRLPVADGGADVVVFNASLHHTADPAVTLREAARAVRPGGRVIVVDSPIYRRAASGRRMVRERMADFERRFGFPSTAQGSREFLVAGELEAIGRGIGLSFEHVAPWAGVRWALRPWAARLRGRREPARFRVSVGVRRAIPSSAIAPGIDLSDGR